MDVRIWQAIIAGGFVALGWLVSNALNRREAARLRAERLRDFHRALFAEIGNNLANLWDEARIQADSEPILARMAEDPDFVPLIPRERNDHVFDTLVGEIHILPRQTIDPVVAYYSQVKSVAALADDMRGEAYKNLSQDRRIALYRDYISMKVQTLRFGRYAQALIDAYAKGGAEGANARALGLSSQASDPSDP